MANAAFDAWVVKFVKAVNVFNSAATDWTRWQKGQIRGRPADPVGSRAQQNVLSLRSDLAVILNSSVIGSAAISSLDKIISTGRTPISIKLIQEWIKKYSGLLG